MLFLANTHPAVDNLKRRVQTQHGEFRTIASHNWRTDPIQNAKWWLSMSAAP